MTGGILIKFSGRDPELFVIADSDEESEQIADWIRKKFYGGSIFRDLTGGAPITPGPASRSGRDLERENLRSGS